MEQTPQFFDATKYDISNGGTPQHPDGKFPFRIEGSGIKPTKEADGHFLEVEYETPAGKISQRFNLWNNNPQAVDIAQKQLSALCYATGVFKLDMNNQGREFHGKQGQLEVRKQKSNPNFSEVWRVFDSQGNEPTKNGGGSQAQPAGTAGAGGWGDKGGSQAQPQPAAKQEEKPATWSPNNQGGGSSAPQTSAPWGPK